MARKKSIKKSAQNFVEAADEISTFLLQAQANQSDKHRTWLYNYAVIRLYREFERLIFDALVGAVNNDTTTISNVTGVKFPLHLTDEVCEFLIVGTGYFDFKGRDGLIKTLSKFVPKNHYLVQAIKKEAYKDTLEKLSALRNYATHESSVSQKAALQAINSKRIESSGSWLKRQNRFDSIINQLKQLAQEIEASAPY